MSDIEKMLESLSRSDMDYRDSFDFNIDAESEAYEKENVSYKGSCDEERYKKPKLKIITAIAASFMVIAGIGVYAVSRRGAVDERDSRPLAQSSLAQPLSEDISVTTAEEPENSVNAVETSESSVKEEIIPSAPSVFPEIETPIKMNFKMRFDMSYQNCVNTVFSVDEVEQRSFIMELLRNNCVEKIDAIQLKDVRGETYPNVNMDMKRDFFPYEFKSEDEEIVLSPKQIYFTLPDSGTELTILSSGTGDFLIMKEDDAATYYKLKDRTLKDVESIAKNIADKKLKDIEERMSCSLKDSQGKNLPVSKKVTDVCDKAFHFNVKASLSQTEYEDVLTGFYTAPEQTILAYDPDGNAVDLPAKNFKIGIHWRNGENGENDEKTINILIIAESTSEGGSFDLTGYTLKGGFDSIVRTDSMSGKTFEEQRYPISFEFEYKFEP